MDMSKYLPYVRVHCVDGDFEVFESGRPEYDTFKEAWCASETIRADMLQVDKNGDPTALVWAKIE